MTFDDFRTSELSKLTLVSEIRGFGTIEGIIDQYNKYHEHKIKHIYVAIRVDYNKVKIVCYAVE
jgi:hypothetical protein